MDASSSLPDVVLAPLLGEPLAASDLSFPVALASAADAELALVAPAIRPGRDPTDLGRDALAAECAAVHEAADALDCFDGRVSTAVRLGESLTQVVAATALEHDADVVAFADADRAAGDHPSRNSLVDATPCNLATVSGTNGLGDVASVLAAVGDGPHSRFAATVAGELAADTDASLTLLRIVSPDADEAEREESRATLEGVVEECIDPGRVDARLTEADDPAAEIVRVAADYDVAVLGGPESGTLRRFAFGSTADSVREAATTPVVTVWTA